MAATNDYIDNRLIRLLERLIILPANQLFGTVIQLFQLVKTFSYTYSSYCNIKKENQFSF